MDIMQAEALRRAQEMHKGREHQQSQRNTQNPQRDISPPQKNTPDTKRDAPKEEVKQMPMQKDSVPLLFEDKEKLLILVLIMILCTEESSDPTLILALLYLII